MENQAETNNSQKTIGFPALLDCNQNEFNEPPDKIFQNQCEDNDDIYYKNPKELYSQQSQEFEQQISQETQVQTQRGNNNQNNNQNKKSVGVRTLRSHTYKHLDENRLTIIHKQKDTRFKVIKIDEITAQAKIPDLKQKIKSNQFSQRIADSKINQELESSQAKNLLSSYSNVRNHSNQVGQQIIETQQNHECEADEIEQSICIWEPGKINEEELSTYFRRAWYYLDLYLSSRLEFKELHQLSQVRLRFHFEELFTTILALCNYNKKKGWRTIVTGEFMYLAYIPQWIESINKPKSLFR